MMTYASMLALATRTDVAACFLAIIICTQQLSIFYVTNIFLQIAVARVR